MKPKFLSAIAILITVLIVAVAMMAGKAVELEQKEYKGVEEEKGKAILTKKVKQEGNSRTAERRISKATEACESLTVPESADDEQASDVLDETVIAPLPEVYADLPKEVPESIEFPEPTLPEIILEEHTEEWVAAPPVETEPETTTAPEESTAAPEYNGTPIYSVNGQVLDVNIQTHLYQQLSAHGIGWFMPYAILIAYQESRFNIYAENVNGLDKGLFQYRITYYPGANIFDPYEQINILSQQMANRANAGCDVLTMISRHNTSDYGAYNQQYVNEVMQHEPGLALISGY